MAPKRKTRVSKQQSGSATKRKKSSDSDIKKLKQTGEPVNKTRPQSNGTAKKDTPQAYSHWLVKSEPNSRFENGIDMKFSFDDLKNCEDQTSCWDGVRNYQARNFLRDGMKVGHDVFFYHSNVKEPGIIGHCKVVKEGYPDHTQFDSKDPHYDSGSKKDNPRWFMVDVQYVRPLERFITLSELKKLHHEHAKSGGPLRNLALFTKARLSVQPISQEEWDFILQLEKTSAD